ncbi:MAG: 2-dehydropantoate 2-reductase [Thermoanaerobaculia bacterium]|nr:2-dehydropantoate 2-reductase [Thermoanaerobaculia bacterium]
MTRPPTVSVFGTGALGMLFAARLARSGARVLLAGTWSDCLAAVARDGIEVVEPGGVWRQRVAETTRRPNPDDAPHRRADVALVLVKSWQTCAVAAAAASAGEVLLTLQNGLGNVASLARRAGTRRVVQGLCSHGATVLAPGRVGDGGGGEVVLPAGRVALTALLREAGFAVRETADLERAVWEKLAVNCAINPVTALAGVRNGALLERSALRERALAAARETAAVAAARGVGPAGDVARRVLAVARRTGGNHSSMLQDLRRGAPTEIDAICGAVVRAGAELGLPTPVNRRLLEAVRRRERRAKARGRALPPVAGDGRPPTLRPAPETVR